MAEKKVAKAAKSSGGFSAEERAAMKERSQEVRKKGGKADGESDVLAKIAEMSQADRALAERIHAIVKATAPDLTPTTWYGMPAYAKDGAMWPTAFALTELTPAVEKKIAALVKKAAR